MTIKEDYTKNHEQYRLIPIPPTEYNIVLREVNRRPRILKTFSLFLSDHCSHNASVPSLTHFISAFPGIWVTLNCTKYAANTENQLFTYIYNVILPTERR